MDTIGSLIDKLFTADMKMFVTQEKLYDIRRATFEQFKEKYSSEEGMKDLYKYFTDVSDLNLQRNNFIDEIDGIVIEMIKKALSGGDLEELGYIQRKHKTLKSGV
jgi:hypothetical protein